VLTELILALVSERGATSIKSLTRGHTLCGGERMNLCSPFFLELLLDGPTSPSFPLSFERCNYRCYRRPYSFSRAKQLGSDMKQRR
jgi:hypothetical protein